MIQRSRFILLIYQRHVILDVYLSVSQWPCVRRVKTYVFRVCVVCEHKGLLQIDIFKISDTQTIFRTVTVISLMYEKEEDCMCVFEVLAMSITGPNTTGNAVL